MTGIFSLANFLSSFFIGYGTLPPSLHLCGERSSHLGLLVSCSMFRHSLHYSLHRSAWKWSIGWNEWRVGHRRHLSDAFGRKKLMLLGMLTGTICTLGYVNDALACSALVPLCLLTQE
jgi:hypothetical protein